MTNTQRQERLNFIREQILLLRGYLANPDTLVNISGDGILESWNTSRSDVYKQLKALELEEKRLTGTAHRIRYADTSRLVR